MARLLISTALAGVLAFAGAALAQPDDHHKEPAHAGHAPAPQAPRPGPAPQQREHVDNRPSAGRQEAPAARPAPQNAMRGPAPQNAMRGPAPQNAMRGPAPQNAMRGPAPQNAMRGPAPGNAMRGPGPGTHAPNPNFASFHRNFNAQHRYHAPAYRRPAGWYSRRWTYGEFLPALFWSHDYWLDDYVDFGLMPPPPGTVWVRYGNDALLIAQDSGEIIQVDYGVFY